MCRRGETSLERLIFLLLNLLCLVSVGTKVEALAGTTSTPGSTAFATNNVNKLCYIALYKPALTLCSLQSDAARAERKHREPRETLADLKLPPSKGLHSVGRLDRDSEGLLLLTNDGMFTHEVHSLCQKRYWVLVKGIPDEIAIEKMRRGGLTIRGAITEPPVSVEIVPENAKEEVPPTPPGIRERGISSWLELVLTEGRNRQVRRITADAGHPTVRLVRMQIGPLRLKGLQPGEWKYVQREDVLIDSNTVADSVVVCNTER